MTQQNNSTFKIQHSTLDFTPPHPLNTAVLFLVFNRLDTTKQVFEAIRQAKPPRLYIAADGAREAKEGETEKVNAVREYIISNIDWECEVKTLFREQNYGCKMAVSGAIDWFFENEEMGIILEDDCLPSQSFFWFCEELLERYKDDMRVWHISGATIVNKKNDVFSYHFSSYPGIWGWASWANRWEKYDVGINNFIYQKSMDFNNNIDINYWKEIFLNVKENRIDTWDFQWIFTMWNSNGLSISPNLNQIQNIGFGADATHTQNQESELSKMETYNIVKIYHPYEVAIDINIDMYMKKKYFSRKSFFFKVISKIKRMLS